MSRFNKNGMNLRGPTLTKWVVAEIPELEQDTPTDTEPQEPESKPKPQGKKRNKKGA